MTKDELIVAVMKSCKSDELSKRLTTDIIDNTFDAIVNQLRRTNASHTPALEPSQLETVKPERVVILRQVRQSKSRQARQLDLSHPRPSRTLCEISVRIPPYSMGWLKQTLGTPG